MRMVVDAWSKSLRKVLHNKETAFGQINIHEGDADLLLLPDIEAGNILYKAFVFFARANVASVILGAKAPIVLTSRADTEESKLNSILLAAAT